MASPGLVWATEQDVSKQNKTQCETPAGDKDGHVHKYVDREGEQNDQHLQCRSSCGLYSGES